jgi:hypothetical protein
MIMHTRHSGGNEYQVTLYSEHSIRSPILPGSTCRTSSAVEEQNNVFPKRNFQNNEEDKIPQELYDNGSTNISKCRTME